MVWQIIAAPRENTRYTKVWSCFFSDTTILPTSDTRPGKGRILGIFPDFLYLTTVFFPFPNHCPSQIENRSAKSTRFAAEQLCPAPVIAPICGE
jgi:hypothetical protein